MRDEPLDEDLPIDLARELTEEKATALRRIGEHLQGILDRIGELRSALAAAHGARRASLVAEHDALIDEAEVWAWYLVVQREAIGLTTHDEILAAYPIPSRLG